MMMNGNKTKWKVTKEEKALYKFLNTISSVLKNDEKVHYLWKMEYCILQHGS